MTALHLRLFDGRVCRSSIFMLAFVAISYLTHIRSFFRVKCSRIATLASSFSLSGMENRSVSRLLIDKQISGVKF
jgi:hypothetical protein